MNNPSAFPLLEKSYGSLDLADPGMTLRDYFAAKMLAGLILDDEGDLSDADRIAQIAYRFADAMLKAREK